MVTGFCGAVAEFVGEGVKQFGGGEGMAPVRAVKVLLALLRSTLTALASAKMRR